MKIATRSLLSALIAAIVNARQGTHRIASRRKEQRYRRILEKHDRKGELRASVLGIDSIDFRHKERQYPLSQIVQSYGFVDEHAFYGALTAKIHEELRLRGWTTRRIHQFETTQLQRVA